MWQKYNHMWCWYCTIWGWYHHMWEKNKGTTECDKSIITYDVSTTQSENDTIKCEKKNKETTECDKSTFTCDFGTAQCKDIKCEKK